MSFNEIEKAYDNYLEIESQLTAEERMHYLKGFQELIKLYRLNTALEAVDESM